MNTAGAHELGYASVAIVGALCGHGTLGAQRCHSWPLVPIGATLQ
jgi:hypothetical protein